jgi:hypothetical protein
MEKWNEICFLISEHKNNNAKEDFFQLEIEHIFERVLGWSRFKKEIITKERTKVGASNSVVPDIIIRNADNNLIVVEVKRPNISIDNHQKQLFSYMRLHKVQFGLLIGEKIQFFYETPNDTKPPKLISEIAFKPDNLEGNEFIELLNKEIYNEDKIIKFCNDKLDLIEIEKEKKDILNFLKSEEGEAYVIKLLADDLYKKHNEEFIDEIISQISISVKTSFSEIDNSISHSEKITIQNIYQNTTGKLPLEFIPNDKDVFKKLLIEKKSAKLIFHYSNGNIEEKDWIVRNFTETSNLIGNLRSRPEARKGKWQEQGIIKIVAQIDIKN